MINYKEKKGIALFIVLGTTLIVILLAGVILSIISSQSRLTHHQVSRIQAYYAAQAGMVYAFEQLRSGAIDLASCPAGGCTINLQDPAFPTSIKQPVKIIILPYGSTGCTNSPGNTNCITTTATYTYATP